MKLKISTEALTFSTLASSTIWSQCSVSTCSTLSCPHLNSLSGKFSKPWHSVMTAAWSCATNRTWEQLSPRMSTIKPLRFNNKTLALRKNRMKRKLKKNMSSKFYLIWRLIERRLKRNGRHTWCRKDALSVRLNTRNRLSGHFSSCGKVFWNRIL